VPYAISPREALYPAPQQTFTPNHPAAEFLLCEGHGTSFNDRKGEWMGVQIAWHDSRRTLTLQLADGSRMLPPQRKDI
jgi:hypothetical protein